MRTLCSYGTVVNRSKGYSASASTNTTDTTAHFAIYIFYFLFLYFSWAFIFHECSNGRITINLGALQPTKSTTEELEAVVTDTGRRERRWPVSHHRSTTR
jgi:hypothetical protein